MSTNQRKRAFNESDFFRRRDRGSFGLFLDGYFSMRSYLQERSVKPISLSSFLHKGSSLTTKPGLYIVPETLRQYGTLADNICVAINQRLQYFGNGILRIGRDKPFYEPTQNYHIDIVGYDIDKNVRIGITTDPAKHSFPAQRVLNKATNSYSDVIWQSAEELGFSLGDDGFILINNFTQSGSSFDVIEFFADYWYKPESFEFSQLDLNPEISLSPITSYKVVYLIKPVFRYNDYKDTTVYYLLVDIKTKLIEYSSFFGVSAGATYTSVYTFEEAYKRYGLKVLGEAFISALTLSQIKLSHLDYLGGGLKKSAWQDAVNIGREFLSYTDIGNWDGEMGAYGNTLILQVPHYLLKDNGGTLTYDDIKNICKKHAAAGTNIILELVGLSIFTEASWDNNVATISWTYVGNFPYSIYYRTLGTESFSLLATIYSSNTNSYTVSNLNSTETYEFYVSANAYGAITTPSNIAILKPTGAASYEETVQLAPRSDEIFSRDFISAPPVNRG